MKKLLFFCLILAQCVYANTVDKKIVKNQKSLQSKTQVERSLSRKLKDIANDIFQEEKRLKKVVNELEKISKSIAKNSLLVRDKEANLQDLTKQNTKLLQKKKALEEKIIKMIAEDFSFYLIADQEYLDSSQSILVQEVLDKMQVIVNKEFDQMSKQYEKINKNIDRQSR